MPLRNDLLNPISPDHPAGESLRYAPVYDKIKEARREDDDAPQGDWKFERKQADWPQAIKLIGDSLATKTKDLQLAAWLAEAMLRREGIQSFREAIELIKGLIENFWDGLYPEIEDGDAEFRAAPLQWLGDKLDLAVKRAPITKGRLNSLQYEEAKKIGREEDVKDDYEKQAARSQAIQDGKIPMEVWDKDFDSTSKQFYVDLEASFDGTLETLDALGQLCDEKFGDVSPSFRGLKTALETTRQTVHILLQKKREKEPDEPVAATEEAPAEGAYETAGEAVAADGGAAAARAPVRRAGALAAEPVDRADAIARVVSAAKFLRQENAYDPAPFLMLRGLRWGELRAAGSSVDQTLLAAPPSEIRQNIKKASLESNWAEVLELAEKAMGMECGRGWLDLQRYVGRACYELGYEAIKSAVIGSLRTLLADYPDLPQMTMMDDTPTANAETQSWIAENAAPAAPAADSAPVQEYTTPAYYEQPAAETPAGEPPPPDPFDLAMQAVRQGRPQEGMELLMREMGQERSGRGRFTRKVQLAKVCNSAGHDEIAFPILKELSDEIERRRLDDWEASEFVADPLALLYRCLGKSGASPEERQKLYAWICRLDPLAAMKVAR